MCNQIAYMKVIISKCDYLFLHVCSPQSESLIDSKGGKTCRRRLIKRVRTDEERGCMAVSQQKYYATKKETDPGFVNC